MLINLEASSLSDVICSSRLIILTFLFVIGISTLIDVLSLNVRHAELARSLSVCTSLYSLFWEKQANVDATDFQFKVIEYVKGAMVFLGCISHYLCCLESPIGILTLSE